MTEQLPTLTTHHRSEAGSTSAITPALQALAPNLYPFSLLPGLSLNNYLGLNPAERLTSSCTPPTKETHL